MSLFKLLQHPFFSGIVRSKVSGGVLQLTLGIAILIATLCSAIILLGYYSRLFSLESTIRSRLRDNAESGIQYLMASRSKLPFNEVLPLDLFDEQTDSVKLIRQPWGVYERITAQAFKGNKLFTKSALITALSDGIGDAVIYLPENNSPLYVAGNTLIEGVAYLPERGISTSFVDGKNYKRSKLMFGERRKSDKQMPVCDTVLIHFIKELLNGNSNGYQVRPIQSLTEDMGEYSNSNRPDYFYSKENIEIIDSLKSGLIIQSKNKIMVKSASKLSGVLLIAPEIEIEDGFLGDAQLFASKLIKIGKDVNLKYPSTLALVGQLTDSLILVKEGSEIEGQVIIQGIDSFTESAGVFKLEKSAIFHGCAYINATTDIQGEFRGHLTTKRIQTSISTTVYPNHIVDGIISHWRKSVYMPGSLLWGSKNEFVVAKWQIQNY